MLLEAERAGYVDSPIAEERIATPRPQIVGPPLDGKTDEEGEVASLTCQQGSEPGHVGSRLAGPDEPRQIDETGRRWWASQSKRGIRRRRRQAGELE